MSRAFCPTCRTMREQMDEYLTEDRESREYMARPLECGHDAGDSGGLPYAPPVANPRRTRALVERVVELQRGQEQQA